MTDTTTHLTEEQLARAEALEAARRVLVARTPVASTAVTDPMNLHALAVFILDGGDPWELPEVREAGPRDEAPVSPPDETMIRLHPLGIHDAPGIAYLPVYVSDPGPEVDRLVDGDGDGWVRDGGAWEHGDIRRSFDELLRNFGPLMPEATYRKACR